MIRIHRHTDPPRILRNRGHNETKKLCDEYDAHNGDYDSGRLKFPTPNNDIYGAISVRNALKKCQGNKCCYSEAKFVRDYVAVEHFRPKGAIGTHGSIDKNYPGYYWLAYEWTNLLLVKPGVNSDKKDYFPLIDDRNRANNHNKDISLEQPKFINPASEDPREHIRFHKDEPRGITPQGRYTVKKLLLHKDLEEARRERYGLLSGLKNGIEVMESKGIEHESITRMKEILDAAILPDAEFSSMAIDLLA